MSSMKMVGMFSLCIALSVSLQASEQASPLAEQVYELELKARAAEFAFLLEEEKLHKATIAEEKLDAQDPARVLAAKNRESATISRADALLKVEELYRKYAMAVVQHASAENAWQPKIGTFHFDNSEASKPLPRVVGSIDEPNVGTFQVMAYEQSTVDALALQNNKPINLTGKIFQGMDNSRIWLTNGVLAPGGSVPTRRKRGGL